MVYQVLQNLLLAFLATANQFGIFLYAPQPENHKLVCHLFTIDLLRAIWDE
jgi:hypothetical protein